MDYFGINTSDELPKINEVLAEQIVMPTLVNAEHFEMEGEVQEQGTNEEGQNSEDAQGENIEGA